MAVSTSSTIGGASIGVGTEGEAPVPVDYGPLGTRYVMQQLDLDEPLLREIAETTGGQYFRATDAEGLARIFETIDALEKSEVESRVRMLYTELFAYAIIPALGLLMLERLLVVQKGTGVYPTRLWPFVMPAWGSSKPSGASTGA